MWPATFRPMSAARRSRSWPISTAIWPRRGTDKSKLLTANVWLKDIGDFAAFNAAWSEWSDKENLPVRATVEAKLADPQDTGRDHGHRSALSLIRQSGAP